MGTLYTKALWCFSFLSYGEAFVALAKLDRAGSLAIFEIVHRGEITDLLFFVAQEDVQVVESCKDDFSYKSFVVIEKPNASLLKTYLNSENNDLDSEVIVFESQDLGALLDFVQDALGHGWKSVEFRHLRSGMTTGYAMMTGPPLVAENRHFVQSWSERGKVSRVSNPSFALRSHFNLQPLN